MEKNSDIKWNGKSRGGSFGYGFFVLLISIFGITFSYLFLGFIIFYYIIFAPKATKAIWWYNRNILRYSRIRSLYKLYIHFYSFGKTLIDKVAIGMGLTNKFSFEFDNYNRFLDILNSNKGVVLIGAHVGNWESGSAFFGNYSSRLNIIMFNNEYEKIKDILNKNSKYKHYNIIPITEQGIESIIQMKKVINKGDYLCFMGDRHMNSSNVINTTFLGKEAIFPQGPFIIASKFNVPVVFYYAMRCKGRKYKFIFKEASGNDIFNQYITSLEDIVKEYPQQWFNFYKFWV